jgi:hypothetical protein
MQYLGEKYAASTDIYHVSALLRGLRLQFYLVYRIAELPQSLQSLGGKHCSVDR